MKYRKLRIAWSVVWGVAAMLICVLWVRSYWRSDVVQYTTLNSVATAVKSDSGAIKFLRADYKIIQDTPPGPGWISESRAPTVSVSSFRLWQSIGLIDVRIAHWAPGLIFVFLSAAPWFITVERFSLRTLLIATTLVALGLGVVVWLR